MFVFYDFDFDGIDNNFVSDFVFCYDFDEDDRDDRNGDHSDHD